MAMIDAVTSTSSTGIGSRVIPEAEEKLSGSRLTATTSSWRTMAQ